MPRNVRNFWLDVHVDGRKSIGTGPASSEGGFELELRVRDHGAVRFVGHLLGSKYQDGRLVVKFIPLDPDKDTIILSETKR